MTLHAILIMILLLMVTTVTPNVKKVTMSNKIYYINSKKITKEDIDSVEVEIAVEEKIEIDGQEEEKKEQEKKEDIEKKEEKVVVIEDPPQEEEEISPVEPKKDVFAFVGDHFSGKMSGYGSDIGDYTACGNYIGNSIFYEDSEYGKVRILAGDRKYPCGTIVKASNTMDGSFIGIVLDRGSDIGREEGKKYLFDLLYKTEKEARQKGVSYHAEFEIMRVGW